MDLENNVLMASDSSGPANSQRRDEIQSNTQIYITIVKASHLPVLKERYDGRNKRFYLNISDGRTKRKTKPIRSTAEHSATWNEKLGPFDSSTSQQITLSLYSPRMISKNKLIGTLAIRPNAQTNAPHPIECDLNPRPHIELIVEMNDTFAIPVTTPPEGIAATNNAPTDEGKAGKDIMEVNIAIDEACTALAFINLHGEWKSALEGVQWVMGVVSDLTALHPHAKAAYDALSLLPKVLTSQFERDENVQALSKAMRDAFDLSQAEELLRAIKPNSNQALILKLMLKHIKICSEVIQKYAEDKDFSKRLLKNAIGGVSAKIKGLSDTLLRLRDGLLRDAAISTQIGVEIIKKSVEILSTRISNNEYDAMIDDLPYKSGWTLTSTKNGRIAGTRTAFVDRILEWISDPSSERVLVLFGQAGTGKSTIAFEIASLFSIEYHICPYFSFSRADITKDEDYHLLTTIIRDLADRHPSFKSALGALIKDKTHLRKSADFNTLFDSLLIPSLESVGDSGIPELLVIDAVDESSDPSKLAAFLARSFNRLPNNFRVLVTSRPEYDIKLEFITTQQTAFGIIEMNDPKLSASIEDDIRVYLQKRLSLSDFKQYGEALVKKSEGLFQWVVVAAGYLEKPPPGFTRNDCMRGILAETQEDKKYTPDLMTPLYTLYRTVLAGYFTTSFTQSRFCSVMSQLFAAVEPISVDTLTGLRHHMLVDNDPEAVPAIVRYLGSVLSNTSSDKSTRAVNPVHVSFRDFLTNPDRRHTFLLDLPNAHVELAHACLKIMLEKLESNICRPESSCLSNSEAVDLQVQIEKWIPSSLQYACRFWHQHVGQISVDDILLDELIMFLRTKLSVWLEVMCLISQISMVASALSSLIECLHVGEDATPTLRSKLNDMIGIITETSKRLPRFLAQAIAMSGPHITSQLVPPIVPHHTPPTSQYTPALEHSSCSSQSSFVPPTMSMPTAMPNRNHSYVSVPPFPVFQDPRARLSGPHWTYDQPHSVVHSPTMNPQLQRQWPSSMPMTRNTPNGPYVPPQDQAYTTQTPSWQGYESTSGVYQSPSMGAPWSIMNAMSTSGQYLGPSMSEGRKKALCIGINYIGQNRALRGCVSDAKRVRDFLIKYRGYKPQDTVLLTDDSEDLRFQPTYQNIWQAMLELVHDPRPNDCFFFQFSGHGGLTKDQNKDERSGWNSVIYPVDGGQIFDDDMHRIMVRPLPKGCRLTGLFDACHSGTALDLPYILTIATLLDRGKTHKSSPADVISWSACNDGHSSTDAYMNGNFIGAMNHAFIKSLVRKPDQTYQELLESVDLAKQIGADPAGPAIGVFAQIRHWPDRRHLNGISFCDCFQLWQGCSSIPDSRTTRYWEKVIETNAPDGIQVLQNVLHQGICGRGTGDIAIKP